jgi:hemerythrin-like domain-containing protein
MLATQILKEEHKLILAVLTCLNHMVIIAKTEKTINTDDAEKILRFFREFSDSCHHQKEEDLLFPALENNGLNNQTGPTVVMKHEHVEGRWLIGGLSDAIYAFSNGDQDACGRFQHYADLYIELLRNHIAKEDHCLFPMSEELLDNELDKQLMAQFHQVEKAAGGNRHRDFIEIARELCTRFDVPFPAPDNIKALSEEFVTSD